MTDVCTIPACPVCRPPVLMWATYDTLDAFVAELLTDPDATPDELTAHANSFGALIDVLRREAFRRNAHIRSRYVDSAPAREAAS